MTHETIHPSLIEDWRQLLADEGEFARTALKNRDRELAEARAFANVAAGHQARAASYRALLREHDPENAEQYAEPAPADASGRERRLDDYRDLIAFWESNAHAPIPGYSQVSLYGPGCETPEELVGLAAVLGVHARDCDGRRIVEKVFGSVHVHASAKLPPQHVESDAERGICRNCGADVCDGECSNPQPTTDAEAVAS